MTRDVRWPMPEDRPHDYWENYSNSRWRNQCAPIIAEVIERVGGSNLKVLMHELRKVYPFHEKRNHPYKIWLSEIKDQLQRRYGNKPASLRVSPLKKPKPKLIGQTSFFPMTPTETFAHQLVLAGQWMKERDDFHEDLEALYEEVLFS